MSTLKSCRHSPWDYAEIKVYSEFKRYLLSIPEDIQHRLLISSDEKVDLYYYIDKYNKDLLSHLLKYDDKLNKDKNSPRFILTDNKRTLTVSLELFYHTKTYNFELNRIEISGMVEEHTTLVQLEKLSNILQSPHRLFNYVIINALELYRVEESLESYELKNINFELTILETDKECSTIKVNNLILAKNNDILYRPHGIPNVNYVKSNTYRWVGMNLCNNISLAEYLDNENKNK